MFYVTGNNGTNDTRFFDVITDAALGGIVAQTVNLPTTTSAHSITVDPFNGDVFVALAGTSAVNPCRASFANPGCIAVFASVPVLVPEPGSLPLLVVGSPEHFRKNQLAAAPARHCRGPGGWEIRLAIWSTTTPRENSTHFVPSAAGFVNQCVVADVSAAGLRSPADLSL